MALDIHEVLEQVPRGDSGILFKGLGDVPDRSGIGLGEGPCEVPLALVRVHVREDVRRLVGGVIREIEESNNALRGKAEA